MDEFRMNFPLSYFQHKKVWYSVYVFPYVHGVWICDKKWMKFKVYFSYVYGVWICDKKGMNFKIYFSYVYRVRISGKEWMNFKVSFSYVDGMLFLTKNGWISRYVLICLWDMKVRWRIDEFQDMHFHLFTGCEFLMCNFHIWNLMGSNLKAWLVFGSIYMRGVRLCHIMASNANKYINRCQWVITSC